MILIKAMQEYEPDRGTKFSTYSISEVIHRFQKMERQRRRSPQIMPCEDLPESETGPPDNFWIRVADVLASNGNVKAKTLLRALLNHYHKMSRCSLAELQRITGMQDKEFRAALLQLSRF